MYAREGFGHNVSELMFGRNMAEFDQAFHELVANEVTIKLDVLGTLVENRILSDIDCSKVVTLHRYGGDGSNGKFVEKATQPR